MSKYRPIFPALIAILLGVCLFFAFRKCDRQKESVKPTPAETELQRHKEREPVSRETFAADTLKAHNRNLALQREIKALRHQLSTQSEKAQKSALDYAKTPTFENCQNALADCQEESEIKSSVIAVQDRIILAADSSQRKDRKEIARSYAKTDSLAAGWDKANKALRQAQKPRPWSLGIQGGIGGTSKGFGPYIGIGIQYTIKRF